VLHQTTNIKKFQNYRHSKTQSVVVGSYGWYCDVQRLTSVSLLNTTWWPPSMWYSDNFDL